LIALAFTLVSFQSNQGCDATALKNELKPGLKPGYKYDSSKTSSFTYNKKAQGREIEVPLFMGEEYLFLFNTNGLSEDIKIEIYSEKIGHKKRKLLYNLEKEEGKSIYSFKPTKSRKMYVNYTIPGVEESGLRGCMVFVVGYQ
ncbi:MAG: hypothetical protein P8Q14_02795, partial [Vicingaceae bacterium]|nr:hypothetical protein [Vicingaceae bacterium]